MLNSDLQVLSLIFCRFHFVVFFQGRYSATVHVKYLKLLCGFSCARMTLTSSDMQRADWRRLLYRGPILRSHSNCLITGSQPQCVRWWKYCKLRCSCYRRRRPVPTNVRPAADLRLYVSRTFVFQDLLRRLTCAFFTIVGLFLFCCPVCDCVLCEILWTRYILPTGVFIHGGGLS